MQALIFLTVVKVKCGAETEWRHMRYGCVSVLLVPIFFFFFFFVLHLSMTSLYQLAQIFCFAQILGAVTEDIDTHTLLLFATSLPSESICKYHGHATSALVGRR